MPKFRKKPIVIEAEQCWLFSGRPLPKGVCQCDDPAAIVGGLGPFVHIHTLEGVQLVTNGDWIITGIANEKYPCKPDIFAATYEAVE